MREDLKGFGVQGYCAARTVRLRIGRWVGTGRYARASEEEAQGVSQATSFIINFSTLKEVGT